MNKSSRANPRTVLFAATGIQFMTGVLYVWSVVSKALISEYGWTSTQATLPYMIVTITIAIMMAVAGVIQDKRGPRLTVTIGAVLMGIGLFLSSFAKVPIVMVLTFSIIMGTGMGFCGSGTLPSAVKWFSPSMKGIINGTMVAGVSMASLFYSPIINFVSGSYSVSVTFMALGIWALVMILILAQFMSSPPAGYIPKEKETKKKTKSLHSGNEMIWKEMIRTRDFYLLWSMFAISSAAGLMIIGHIANIAKTQAHWEGGYLLVVLLALFNTAGRLLGGALSDRFGRAATMRMIFAVQIINVLLFSLYTTPGMLAIGVILGGFCYGTGLAVFPASTADYFGMKNLGLNGGLMFTAWGMGGVVGPLIASSIVDATGSYNTAYFIAAALLVVAIGVSFAFKKAKQETKAIEDSIAI